MVHISVGSSGTHSVCVCTSHQNAQLLVHAANIDKDYHDLMAMVVCDLNTKMCMIHRCENCPGDNNLREYLDGTFADSEEEEISFQQWQGTDRAMLCTQTTSIIEFLELFVDAISKLTVHSFIAKCQARYLKDRKDNLLETSCMKKELPHVIDIEYFSDGCAGQYKNFKNILNLCHHVTDFGITARWSFFATSHGKSPCDGIGGTVKRLVARASLQRPLDNQILSMEKMFECCKSDIKGINFIKVSKEDIAPVRQMLSTRFESGKTIPGTRSFHHFSPFS